jgi:hypothetical protein
VPDPADLLAVARVLLSAGSASPPSDAQLRRAVSTAYYALFHKVLGTGAERFMGAGNRRSAGYSLLYRSFNNHGRMQSVCEALNVPTLSKTLQQQLGRPALSQDMRDFASDFVALQEKRHLANYDPSVIFVLSDSANQVDIAEAAMLAFDRATSEEKADVLALMLSGARG